jgi:hypothetical protein
MLAAGLLGLAACGDGAVHVDRFQVTGPGHTTCQEFLAALPDELAGEHRRRVTGSTFAAAWGDPAIVLRCGVPLPEDFASSPCITRDGIGWSVPADQADRIDLDAVMTLAFRSPEVQVRVPRHYRPNGPSEVMADLDGVIRAHTTATGECT